jgi:hypothetical protein
LSLLSFHPFCVGKGGGGGERGEKKVKKSEEK